MKCEVRRMRIGDIIMDVAVYPDIDVVIRDKLQTRTPYRGSATKSGANPKSIKARRKKNKNKKTHRR